MNATQSDRRSDATNLNVLDLAEVRWLCDSGVARTVRESAALSLREIGSELEIPPNTISTWERSMARPTGSAAIKYLQLLRSLRGMELSRER